MFRRTRAAHAPAAPMQYRRLGRSNLMVSAVGFGTCQLRRVPEQQALDTLKRGFALGVIMMPATAAPRQNGAAPIRRRLTGPVTQNSAVGPPAVSASQGISRR